MPDRAVRFTYWNTGDVSNITIQDAGDPTRRYDLACYYRTGPLWLTVRGTWTTTNDDLRQPFDSPPTPGSYAVSGATAGREFRYHSGRARHMARVINTPSADYNTWTRGTLVAWTDYDGDEPCLDSIVDVSSGTPVITPAARYTQLSAHEPVGGAPRYWYEDLIGSTVMTTGDVGQSPVTVAYTAFGEMLGTTVAYPPGNPGTPPAGSPRYQYAGGWGYESGGLTGPGGTPDPWALSLQGYETSLPPLTFQHVGWRWYAPALGRFLMRDPTGLTGGINVYLYCDSNPADSIDPEGEYWVRHGPCWARWIINLTGGGGRIPIIDPGRAQNAVVTGATVVSVGAPVGACVRVITLTPKALAVARTGWAGKYLVRLRQYIRHDRVGHHGKPPGHWHINW